MIFKNAMGFKAKVKQVAKDKGITAQQVQHNYLIEAFLTKLSLSTHKSNFIVKGGFLIGGMIGLELRATMDLDTTVKGFELTPENLSRVAEEIINIPTEESFTFVFQGVEEIRETDDYPGYRMKLFANFEQINEVITVDVTTGDVITPKEIDFNLKKMFSEDKIELLSYPIETVLAEKLETILSRGIGTTRPRDFYDVYLITKTQKYNINTFKKAFSSTAKHRGTEEKIKNVPEILKVIKESRILKKQWEKYQREYLYARDITYDDTVMALYELMKCSD